MWSEESPVGRIGCKGQDRCSKHGGFSVAAFGNAANFALCLPGEIIVWILVRK